MTNFNFLSKSSSQSCGHSSVTLASTVGSPSAHRRGTMFRLLSVLVLVLTVGVGQMWGADVTLTLSDNTTDTWTNQGASGGGTAIAMYDKTVTGISLNGESGYCDASNGYTRVYSGKTFTVASTVGNITKIVINAKRKNSTGSISDGNTSKNLTTSFTDYTWNYSPGVSSMIFTSSNQNYIKSITVTYTAAAPSCTNSVTIAKGTESNATLSFSSESVATCSSTETDRQVTVSVAPASCYAAPVAASVTTSGTTATPVSGPTWNNTTSKYDYVYQFAKDATGTTTFNVSLSTKTTYTVNYNKGNATGATGDASSDTKTCGVALTLPNSALFTRTGYTQQGWSTAQAGTTKTYDLGGIYTTDAATTLYPYWGVNSYSVTWKVNNTIYSAGGSATVNHGSRISTLPTPPNPASYCGDKFVGWTTDEVYTHGTSPLYTTASGFPTASNAQTFYAVFADYAN